MTLPRRVRLVLLGAVTPIVAGLLALAASPSLQGPSIDSLYWLREHLYGPRPAPDPSPVVVVGIDEETYRRPPFAGTPQALWGPRLGTVLGAILDGGAAAIGLDLVHPTSVETLIPGFERDYLLTLRRGGKEGRLVLAKVQHQSDPLMPYRGYMIAAGINNIRSVNLVEDPDGVLRRVPLTLSVSGSDGQPKAEPGMAVEVASRALKAPLERAADGSFTLGGHRLPGGEGNRLLVNHATAAGAIPTYSLADLHACAEAGKADYFAKHFKGKAVMVGTVLDVEDRKLSSNRWVTKPEGLNLPERCALPVMSDLYVAGRTRDSIPGVYIHAAAISNLMTRDALSEVGKPAAAALVLLLAGVAALVTLAARPPLAAAGLILLLAVWSGVSVGLFRGGLVLPYLQAALAALLVFPLALGFRFAVLDRDQRHIRNAFKLYLPGSLIDDMIASGQSPSLGGEERDLSILFCDIAGFTKMSEGMEPEALVTVLNRYFTVMTDIIEAHGGFVDKYIGDAVLAVFGAPYAIDNHARAAVAAALAMRQAMADDPTLLATSSGRGSNRIGIATGPALIGNIGSPRRFNYTVMGDTVNLASRLEGANKYYNTALMVSGETVRHHGDPEAFRSLDIVQVVGRSEPVEVFEPLSEARRADPEDRAQRAAYAAALDHWRAGHFDEAVSCFRALAAGDGAALAMLHKAEKRLGHPAEPGWAGVTALTDK
ncbi:adenylate/guanylate cyclase domain-containing protein (plasmid) [Azospirillum humicireducens]|uniref:Adenylate/guanylate cyclase domain-containing protein n=1 Tax=Azospirillum humicireducens TaxID=1226968 RepID=A0A2R4VXN0_9PROT|nr:adenylate/guanylate cyclase domain-containing protein [Azospirillum humicireducens]AWB09204.1 adenylate/guanylate cyclase domain-containing protein [Azospirillum humicireducens]